jgi:hypothetical protein
VAVLSPEKRLESDVIGSRSGVPTDPIRGAKRGVVATTTVLVVVLSAPVLTRRHKRSKRAHRDSVGPLCSIDSLFCLPTSFGSRRISS